MVPAYGEIVYTACAVDALAKLTTSGDLIPELTNIVEAIAPVDPITTVSEPLLPT
jgi:hypothetical protein